MTLTPEQIDIYKKETGIDPCLTCSGSVHQMIQYFKNKNMSNFKLRTPSFYKCKTIGKTIHNGIMTDDLALSFLRVNPSSRIRLFSVYPENWKELLGLGSDVPTSDPTTSPNDAPVMDADGPTMDVPEGEDAPVEAKTLDLEPQEGDKEECSECDRRKELQALKMGDLKELYPEVKVSFGMKKSELIDAIIEWERDNV